MQMAPPLMRRPAGVKNLPGQLVSREILHATREGTEWAAFVRRRRSDRDDLPHLLASHYSTLQWPWNGNMCWDLVPKLQIQILPRNRHTKAEAERAR